MSDHTATLMAFARGFKAPKPEEQALCRALAAGLVERHVRIRQHAGGEETSITWRISKPGREVLRAHLDTLPSSSWPRPPIRRSAKSPAPRTRRRQA